ncbi:MAG: tetratricopeptide repeat protein [Paramuribaculum sp.]|nr:tetratricopeptide repeat protein [Paramuribaculum sp.]
MTYKIKLAILFITAASLWCSPAKSFADETPYIKMMGAADSAIAKGDWEIAEKYLRTAMRMEPANPANLLLLSNLGMIQFYQGQDSLALSTLTDACNIAPRTVPVLANRATVYEALGKYDEALSDCNRILAIDTANVRARAMRINYYMRKGKASDAEADLDTLLQYSPDNQLALILAGNIYTSTGRYAEAISPLTKVIEKDPQAEYYAVRALCRIMTGNLNDASSDIAEGLRINPSEGELYLYRAVLNKMRYRNDDAKSDAKRAVKLGVSQQRVQQFLK